MLHKRVNGYDMAYVEMGDGPPLVCVHGSLCDFRAWVSVMGPLSRAHRVIAVSLRHFFPEHWDGVGGHFKIDQHVADTIAFVNELGVGKVDLMGHSRGGHIAFRVAQQRPDLLRRLVLAEPGGDLDASLMPSDMPPFPPMRERTLITAEKIRAGDIEGGMEFFVDALDGKGAWRAMAGAPKQMLRDNARTFLGQIDEERRPYARSEAESISVPTLFVAGEKTPGSLPVALRALAAHVPGARTEVIPAARHFMMEDNPVRFCDAVLRFLPG